MKTIGLILVFCFPVILGLEARRYMKMGLENIKETLNFMIFIREEIRFSCREISEIFAIAKAERKINAEIVSSFVKAFFEKEDNEKQLKNLNFNRSEIELSKSFFKGLGTNDINSQVRHCDYYIGQMAEKINERNKDFLNKSKVYLGISFAAALTLVIVLS